MRPDLAGEQFSLEDPRSTRKRGRPKTIEDATLAGLRDSFVWVLENNWGEVGYELGRSKTVAQIRSALGPVASGIYADRFNVFVRPTRDYASTLDLRRMRIEQGELIDRLKATFDAEQKCQESAYRAAAALQQSQGTSQQQAMQHEHVMRTAALHAAQQHWADLDAHQRELANEVASKEAGFAQDELLRFIRDRRYSFIPLNFANAMAGLPYMGWRQSHERCALWRCEIANGLVYRQFKVVSAFSQSEMQSRSMVESMRLFLQRKSKAKDDAAAEIKKKWYYMRRALEQAEGKKHTRKALPFRLVAEFQRLVRSATAADRILEEEEQLW